MRESPATAIREWALQWPPAPIPESAMAESDRVLGSDFAFGHMADGPESVWFTYWLFVAEAMEAL